MGNHASRQRFAENDGVGCMGVHREAARRPAIPMHCGMVIIPPQPLRAGVSYLN